MKNPFSREKNEEHSNSDEITTLTSVHREPEYCKPPTEDDKNFYCREWGNASDKLSIYMKWDVYEKIMEHAEANPRQEVGGVLLGKYCQYKKKEFIKITDVVIATMAEGSASRLAFTQDAWEHIHREIDGKGNNEIIVGWYHTHPGMGIFLSTHDQFVHTNFFTLSWQVAFVVDPRQKSEGFFRYEDDKQVRYKGFYFYGDYSNQEEVAEFIGLLNERKKYGGNRFTQFTPSPITDRMQSPQRRIQEPQVDPPRELIRQNEILDVDVPPEKYEHRHSTAPRSRVRQHRDTMEGFESCQTALLIGIVLMVVLFGLLVLIILIIEASSGNDVVALFSFLGSGIVALFSSPQFWLTLLIIAALIVLYVLIRLMRNY